MEQGAERVPYSMKKLIDQSSERVSAAFEQAGFDPALGRCAPSNRPDLCQYQCNGAMAGAKLYRTAPFRIAENLPGTIALKVRSPLKSDEQGIDLSEEEKAEEEETNDD